MSTETPKTIETLRLSLIVLLTTLQHEMHRVHSLAVEMKSFLDTLKEHDPELHQKYENALAHVPDEIRESHLREQRAIDGILEILRAIPKEE